MHWRTFAGGLVVSASLALSAGCASYYSHYGTLNVETAEGQTRKAVISWQSADRPNWMGGPETTPITLETQCSERVLTFREAGDASNRCAPEGESAIVWCGDPKADRVFDQSAMAKAGSVCGQIVGANGASQISELGSRLDVTVSCWPDQAVVGEGEDAVNRDYLRASRVPYPFVVKTVEMGSSEDRKPVLSEKICEEE